MTALTVIMSARLSSYPNAPENHVAKFHRALHSFLESQVSDPVELIVASDGCDKVDREWDVFRSEMGCFDEEVVVGEKTLRHIRIEKTTSWYGAARNAAIECARGRLIAYLDSDDMVTPSHFADIITSMGDHDWIWFDYLHWPEVLVKAEIKEGRCGTCTIAHVSSLPIRWCDAYAADWKFISDARVAYPNYAYRPIGGYIVCHIPGVLDV